MDTRERKNLGKATEIRNSLLSLSRKVRCMWQGLDCSRGNKNGKFGSDAKKPRQPLDVARK